MRSHSLGALTAVFAAILPFTTARFLYAGGANAKYFLALLFSVLLLSLGAWAVYKGKLALGFKRRRLLYAIGLVLLAYYVAAFVGVFPERSLWSDILRSTGVFFLTYLAIAAYLLGETMNVRGWSLVRRAVAISAGVFSLITFLGAEGFGVLNRFLWLNLNVHGLTFGNSTFAGAYMVLALILCLIEISRAEEGSRIRKILIASALVILFSPALFTFSASLNPVDFLGQARASSVTAWLLVAFLIGWRFLRNKNLRRVWAGLFIVSMFAGLALLFTPGSFVQEKYIETSTAARIIVWESSVQAIRERPVLGYGSENFDIAFQKYFDTRLYQSENVGEIWFDRAHNIMIDTLVDVGVVGALAMLVLVACFLRVVYRARNRRIIGSWEAVLLSILPFAHFLQLQTSFDTVGTYVLLGLIGGYVLWLEREMTDGEAGEYGKGTRSTIAGVMVILALLALKALVFDEYVRQASLIETMRTADNAKQEVYIDRSLARTSSFESLRVSSEAFINGALDHLEKGGSTQLIPPRLTKYEGYYKAYLEETPDHYRARMNYAYLLLLKTTMGENRLNDAKTLLADSERLSPGHPLTSALRAVASLYSGNIAEARSIVAEAIAADPDTRFLRDISAYIERQAAQFPNVTILNLENL